MIKRISKVKNFGVFQNYTRDGDIQDFQPLNIIYGWNYTGKTTLSRLFQCFEESKIHNDYPTAEFEICDNNDRKYTHNELEIDNTHVRVFNSDFVARNINWGGGTFSPIFLLGEESLEAEKRINEKTKYLEKLNKTIYSVTAFRDSLSKEIEEGITAKAGDIKYRLGLVNSFTKAHLRPILELVKQNPDQYLLDSTTMEKLISDATINKDDKLPIIPLAEIECNFSNIFSEVKILLGTVPSFSKTIKYFLDNPDIAKWVESGIQFHQQKNVCEYCGNQITEKRKSELLQHFSEDLTIHQNALSGLIHRLNTAIIQFTPYTTREFYQSLREIFGKRNAAVVEQIDIHNNQLKLLLTFVQNKKDNPFTSITDFTQFIDNTVELLNALNEYNKVISDNNEITERFESVKNSAVVSLQRHFSAEFLNEYGLSTKELLVAANYNRENRLLQRRAQVEEEINGLKTEISTAQKGKNELNELIQKFLGDTEISVDIVNEKGYDNFCLKRKSNLAKNLSEGEKMAVAFSFYLTKLKENDDPKKVIVYIDDPISSLDYNHIFQVNALIKDKFFNNNNQDRTWELNYQQLIISTHNYDFFSLLRELPLKKNETSYYYIRKIGCNESKIEKLPKAIRCYSSEYHFLFHEIYKYHIAENKNDFALLYHLPNAIRRFIELYTFSKIPTNKDTSVDTRTSELFGTEKSKRIMKVMHYFSHANNIERIMNSSDLLCDINNAVDDFMEELEKDTLHYKALLDAIS